MAKRRRDRPSERFSPPDYGWGFALRQFLFSFPFYFIDRLGPGLVFIGLVYVGVYLPVRELAGKNTAFIVDILSRVFVSKWAYWTLLLLSNGFFAGAWYRQRKAHHDYIKRHAGQVKELQERIDENRGTSGLINSGTVPKRKGSES